MKISLAAIRIRLPFLAGVCLLAAALIYPAARIWLAAHWAASFRPERLLRAAELEPGNADYWHHLGLFEQWDFERGDLRKAVQYYRRAVAANSHKDLYWLDLASAYEALSETARAREAFQNAEADHPASSEVAWRYGTFLLRQGDFSAAFGEIHRAVMSDPKLATSSVAQCWKSTQDVTSILERILPRDRDLYFEAINYFASTGEFDAARIAWQQTLALGQPIELPQTLLYVNALIEGHRIEEAHETWKQSVGASGHRELEDNSSLIFNGSFEQDPLNGGFDWRQQPTTNLAVEFDTRVAHSGTRSLRLLFDGTANLDFRPILQYVAVEPEHRYRFTAYVRTSEVTTDSGIRFSLLDVHNPAALSVLTPSVVGTEPWSLVEAEFTTGPETNLIVVMPRRMPSLKFDNKIRGAAWIDDVSLVPIADGRKDDWR